MLLQQQAASTTVYCATALDLHAATGFYFNNCCRCPPSAAALGPELAEELWKLSEEMIKDVLGPDAAGLNNINTANIQHTS